MDRGAWWATIHCVRVGRDRNNLAHMHAPRNPKTQEETLKTEGTWQWMLVFCSSLASIDSPPPGLFHWPLCFPWLVTSSQYQAVRSH